MALDNDAHFKYLERQRIKALQRGNEPDVDLVHTLSTQLQNYVYEMAESYIAKTRDFLEERPEGIPRSTIPLDSDDVFRGLEEERRALMHHGASAIELAPVGSLMNERVHQLALVIRG